MDLVLKVASGQGLGARGENGKRASNGTSDVPAKYRAVSNVSKAAIGTIMKRRWRAFWASSMALVRCCCASSWTRRRKAGLVPPRGQEGAEAAARSLASDSVRGQGGPFMKLRGGEFSTGTTGNFQPELTQ